MNTRWRSAGRRSCGGGTGRHMQSVVIKVVRTRPTKSWRSYCTPCRRQSRKKRALRSAHRNQHRQAVHRQGPRQPHGRRDRPGGVAGPLRHSRAARGGRSAEAGCSVHEIMAITGHRTLAEVEWYTKAAEPIALGPVCVRPAVVEPEVDRFPELVRRVGEIRRKAQRYQRRPIRLALPTGVEPVFSD
jgi:hypothetical protein